MKTLVLIGESSDLLISELGKLCAINKYDADNLDAVDGFVFDLKNDDAIIEEDYLVKCREDKIPIILLNANADKICKLFGLGLQSNIVIITFNDNSTVFQPINTDVLIDNGIEKFIEVKTAENGKRHMSDENELPLSGYNVSGNDLNESKLAKIIENNITKKNLMLMDEKIEQLLSVPIDLPAKQYHFYFVDINFDYNNLEGQIAENRVTFCVALIASFNPKCKYVRVGCVGAGCNPTGGKSMKWDDTYNRGYFQKAIHINMLPSSSKISTYETSPKNLNNQTSYTAETSFTVGVDISKEPSFNASYTVTDSVTSTVSDFDIQNNSSGLTAHWDFEMGITKSSIWDLFNEPAMRKAQVKELPNLAKKNFQPVCEAVWRVNNDPVFRESVTFEFSLLIDYYHCWVTGDWTNYVKHYRHCWPSSVNRIILDFDAVNC